MKIKKILAGILSAMVLSCYMLSPLDKPFTEMTVSADVIAEGTCGTNLEWWIDDSTLYIVNTDDYYHPMKNYSYSTTPGWYSYRNSIRFVELWGATSIGAYAFTDLVNLEYVFVYSPVKSIGDYAFRNCPTLQMINYSSDSHDESYYEQELYLGANDKSTVNSIGFFSFSGCSSLDCLDLSSVTNASNIDSQAFYNGGTASLTHIHIPAGASYSSYASRGLPNNSAYYFNCTTDSYGQSICPAHYCPFRVGLGKTSVTASSGNGQATLSWAPVPGADGYEVYFYNEDGTRTYLTTVTETTCNVTGLQNGVRYGFVVLAGAADEDGILITYKEGNVAYATPTLSIDETKAGNFVERLYTKLLGRPSEAQGKADHLASLRQGNNAATVAAGFLNSAEFINMNLSNEEYVSRMYATFLDRPAAADPSSANWVQALYNGCSRDLVFHGFVESAEFTNLCEEYSIVRGSVPVTQNRDKNPEVTAFVAQLYRNALGTANPDEAGLNGWTGAALEGGRASLASVAHGFIFSEQFANQYTTNEQIVTQLYRSLFGREPDEGGKNAWLSTMANGASKEEVFNGFIGSLECSNYFDSFGI